MTGLVTDGRSVPLTGGGRRFTFTFCVATLVVAVLHPPAGLGLPVCGFHTATRVPCPGCGLTRSISRTVRGDFAAAWKVHPFGLLLVPVALAVVIVGMLPRQLAAPIANRWAATPLARYTYWAFVGVFVAFGAARAVGAMWRVGLS